MLNTKQGANIYCLLLKNNLHILLSVIYIEMPFSCIVSLLYLHVVSK